MSWTKRNKITHFIIASIFRREKDTYITFLIYVKIILKFCFNFQYYVVI